MSKMIKNGAFDAFSNQIEDIRSDERSFLDPSVMSGNVYFTAFTLETGSGLDDGDYAALAVLPAEARPVYAQVNSSAAMGTSGTGTLYLMDPDGNTSNEVAITGAMDFSTVFSNAQVAIDPQATDQGGSNWAKTQNQKVLAIKLEGNTTPPSEMIQGFVLWTK